MKKYVSGFFVLCLLGMLVVGCAKKEALELDGSVTETQSASSASSAVDVDLTVLSSTMVFAEVNNIMVNPDDYMGKTIKMNGVYASSYGVDAEVSYHFVVIQDAAGCCPQGLEFIWNGEHRYPEDYPENMTEIEVVGIYDSYDEYGKTYYYLAVEDIAVL